MQRNSLLAPVIIPGTEPWPAGTTEEEKQEMRNMVKYQKWGGQLMESCPVKVLMAGTMGFGLGGFVAMMSATFAYEDPLSRASSKLTGTAEQAKFIFKELGRNMWSSGKGFAKVGALYSGIECCIEGYRAKNDIWNGVWGGAATGAILARNSGPMGTVFGAAGFAAFSGAIELFLRRAPAEQD